MTHRFQSGVLLSMMIMLLFWAGCADSESPRIAELDQSAPETAGTTEMIEGTETLDEGDFDMVVLGPELTRTEERGLMIFRHYCAHCHGEYGYGDGPNSFGLETAPRDLQDIEMDSRTDEELRLVITEGGAARGLSRLMPPWGHTLEPHRINDLVEMIRILPDLEEPEDDSGFPSLDEGGDEMDDFSL